MPNSTDRITPRRRVGSIVVFLLLAILVMQTALIIVSLRNPKPGRFLPLVGNPYLLLDTAAGTECLRVPKNRAQEMPNWLLYTERDKDVQDSYTAALVAYGELKKHYAEEYAKAHQPTQGNSLQGKHPDEDAILDEVRKLGQATAEADKQADEQSKKELDALTRLFHSTDSIPVCSTQ
jgi:hypothetical protein